MNNPVYIPVGFQVTVTTCENDADYFMSQTINGLTKDDVEFIVKLCKIHDGELGNMYDPYSNEKQAYQDELKKLIDSSYGHNFNLHISSVDEVLELATELALYGCTEFYTRDFDSIKVEYIPHVIELHDVTSEFI